jgi:N-acetylglutamate synthase-like GNAT family acetyltransferase
MSNSTFKDAVLPEGYSFVDKNSVQPEEIIALRESVSWRGDTVKRWQKCIDQSLSIIGVRDSNSTLVGMACIAGNARHAVLCDLAVSPSHQRIGIGAAIMSELLKSANDLDISYLYAELADTNPFRTQMLASGFKVTGDSLFMEASA